MVEEKEEEEVEENNNNNKFRKPHIRGEEEKPKS